MEAGYRPHQPSDVGALGAVSEQSYTLTGATIAQSPVLVTELIIVSTKGRNYLHDIHKYCNVPQATYLKQYIIFSFVWEIFFSLFVQMLKPQKYSQRNKIIPSISASSFDVV